MATTARIAREPAGAGGGGGGGTGPAGVRAGTI